MVSGLAFRSLIHFEFVFVYGVRKYFNFTLLYMAIQFPQHHLLKRLSFLCFKMSTNKNAGEDVEKKGIHLHCWWEWKLTQPLWRTVWRFLKRRRKKKKKLGIKLPYDPEIPLLGVYSGETITEKRHMYSNVHCSTI